MKELEVKAQESGQRFDKYLSRYLKEAPKSFLYKMLRKKNITLNGKKQGTGRNREGKSSTGAWETKLESGVRDEKRCFAVGVRRNCKRGT